MNARLRQRGARRWAAMRPWRAHAVGACVALLLPVLTYHAARAALNGRRFLVQAVEVEGLEQTTLDDVYEAAGLARPRNILTCDAETMQRRIEALPWVRGADVRIESGAQIDITVREATLRALVAAGELLLVDVDGEVIRPWAPDDGVNAPILFGFGDESGLRRAEVLRGYSVLNALRDAALPGSARDVRALTFGPLRGFSVVLGDGTRVDLGSNEHQARIARLEEVYSWLEQRDARAEYVVLSGDDLNRVALKLRDGGEG